MLHGVPALVITSDIPIIVSPLACQLLVLEIKPLEIVTGIAIHTIIVALILEATLVIDTTAGNVITSQLLVTTKAKVTMLNTKVDPDQDHIHDQGPVLVLLQARGTIMVTTFVMMTLGEGNSHAHPLPSLA